MIDWQQLCIKYLKGGCCVQTVNEKKKKKNSKTVPFAYTSLNFLRCLKFDLIIYHHPDIQTHIK